MKRFVYSDSDKHIHLVASFCSFSISLFGSNWIPCVGQICGNIAKRISEHQKTDFPVVQSVNVVALCELLNGVSLISARTRNN